MVVFLLVCVDIAVLSNEEKGASTQLTEQPYAQDFIQGSVRHVPDHGSRGWRVQMPVVKFIRRFTYSVLADGFFFLSS